jgi:hypothetical protein
MKIGTLEVGAAYNMVPVALTNYQSVPALRYEQFHTRLLLFGTKGRGFWSPYCEVGLASRISDARLIGVCQSMPFTSCVYMQIMNVVAADYDRREMAKILNFEPFEIAAGKEYRFQYQFLLRGRK